MGYKLRQFTTENKFSQVLTLDALAHAIRPDPTYPLPKASALTYRRYQLGVRPLASPQTPGAFLFGRRLMAIDSTLEDLPDTPDNVAVFGRYLMRINPDPRWALPAHAEIILIGTAEAEQHFLHQYRIS